MQGARTAAAVMAADEDNLRAQVTLEGSVTFDSQGNRLGKQVGGGAMPATPDQVGRLVQASRQLISDAMPYTSAPQPMAELALALHRQYRDRLAQFETIREITVVVPTPLHLICLQHGLPYNTAERLALLNGMRNPSFTEGTVRLYAA
jgi:prophage DNA circulation protein